jgi:hypothetical protein
MHRAFLASSLVACTSAATPARSPAASTPIRALLVLHPLDRDGHAYVLACARRETGKPTAWLDVATCATLLRGVRLELVDDAARVALTGGATGDGYPCPDGDAHQPFVAVAGVPADTDRGFVATAGIVAATADDRTIAAIAARHPALPDKRPRHEDGLSIVGAFDIDGDGAAEVVTEHLGWYRVWSATGELLGAVGCAFG